MSLKSPSIHHDDNNAGAFQFSESAFQKEVKGRSLQLEKVYYAPIYDGIEEDHPMQKRVIKACFRSKIYPEITAESEADIEKYLKPNALLREEDKTHEAIQHSI